LKTELTEPDALAEFMKMTAAKDEKEAKRIVGGLVDVLEMSLLGEPFRRAIQVLCEQARHRVLAMSVQKIDPEDSVEAIIQAAWLADIDGKKGRVPLTDAIEKLSAAPFFRVNLATHFLMRVYWSHWRKEDRFVLLDAAEEVIKPLQLGFDKPKLKRYIEKDDASSPP
jgi:hypothetical protein